MFLLVSSDRYREEEEHRQRCYCFCEQLKKKRKTASFALCRCRGKRAKYWAVNAASRDRWLVRPRCTRVRYNCSAVIIIIIVIIIILLSLFIIIIVIILIWRQSVREINGGDIAFLRALRVYPATYYYYCTYTTRRAVYSKRFAQTVRRGAHSPGATAARTNRNNKKKYHLQQ